MERKEDNYRTQGIPATLVELWWSIRSSSVMQSLMMKSGHDAGGRREGGDHSVTLCVCCVCNRQKAG